MQVSSFKEKIADEIGVPVNQQRLIFRGRVLKDDHILSEYRILPFWNYFHLFHTQLMSLGFRIYLARHFCISLFTIHIGMVPRRQELHEEMII